MPYMTPEFQYKEALFQVTAFDGDVVIFDNNEEGIVPSGVSVSDMDYERLLEIATKIKGVFGVEIDVSDADEIRDAIESRPPGFMARMSAFGYLDSTDWEGPFETATEAVGGLSDLYDTDDDAEEEREMWVEAYREADEVDYKLQVERTKDRHRKQHNAGPEL